MRTLGPELHQVLALDLSCLISLSFRFLHDCSKNNSKLQSLALTSLPDTKPSPLSHLILISTLPGGDCYHPYAADRSLEGK